MVDPPPQYPEIPYPFPPGREPPARTEPVAVPAVNFPGSELWDHLAHQRKILLSGPLDRDAITIVSAQLMAFDGESSRDVEIIVNSQGGPVADILAVLDVFDLMRARVNTTCIGSAMGTAAALVACGTGHRQCAPHATVSLRCSDVQSIDGTTSDIVREAEELAALRRRLIRTISVATGLSEDIVADELDHGSVHSPSAARDLGLIDDIAERPNSAGS